MLSAPLLALLGFAMWTLLLPAIGIAGSRTVQVLLRQRKANSFSAGDAEEHPLRQRLARAHLNCVENLPVFGAVAVVAHLAGAEVDLLAWTVLGARVVQSSIHIVSTRELAVWARATFWFVQVVAMVGMAVQAATSAG